MNATDNAFVSHRLSKSTPPRVVVRLIGAPAEPFATTESKSLERQTIARVMSNTDGNMSKAARQLGISRSQLYLRLRRHGFETAIR